MRESVAAAVAEAPSGDAKPVVKENKEPPPALRLLLLLLLLLLLGPPSLPLARVQERSTSSRGTSAEVSSAPYSRARSAEDTMRGVLEPVALGVGLSVPPPMRLLGEERGE